MFYFRSQWGRILLNGSGPFCGTLTLQAGVCLVLPRTPASWRLPLDWPRWRSTWGDSGDVPRPVVSLISLVEEQVVLQSFQDWHLSSQSFIRAVNSHMSPEQRLDHWSTAERNKSPQNTSGGSDLYPPRRCTEGSSTEMFLKVFFWML